jgi:hypothetical protein
MLGAAPLMTPRLLQHSSLGVVMADIGAALVTGSATIVGVVAGAGLTYWSSALNRRHQEAREDKTRWYEARLQAYVELHRVAASGLAWGMPLEPSDEDYEGPGSPRSITDTLIQPVPHGLATFPNDAGAGTAPA